MTKKMIIISIISVLLVAGLTTLLIILLRGNPIQPQTVTETTAVLGEAPDYKTCSVISPEDIKASFGDAITSLSDASTKAAAALNGEVAEECQYTFSTSESKDNTFGVQSYQASSIIRDSTGVPLGDESWFVIPGITIAQTALYKTFDNADAKTRTYLLSVATPTRFFLYSIVQPLSAATIDVLTAMDILAKLANAGNYTVENPTDAPPAPPTGVIN